MQDGSLADDEARSGGRRFRHATSQDEEQGREDEQGGRRVDSRSGSFTLVTLVRGTLVAVEEVTLPAAIGLAQNSPNPFNPWATVSFTLGRPGRVGFCLFNLLGAEVQRVDRGVLAGLASRRYLYQLRLVDTAGRLFETAPVLALAR